MNVTLRSKVKVFTANHRDYKDLHGKTGIVIGIRRPCRFCEQDESLPITFTIYMGNKRIITLPEGCVYERWSD